MLALCGAADGALRGSVAPRDADEQRAKSRRALEEVIEVVPAAEAAALAEQQAAAAAMAKAEAMMAAAKAAQAKAEADELEARAGATTTALFPGEICTAADLKGVLSTDANLTAYSAGRWAAVERKRARRQVRLERCPLERVRGRPTQSTVGEADHRCRFVGFNTLCAVHKSWPPRHRTLHA